jgi:hypothetical protein
MPCIIILMSGQKPSGILRSRATTFAHSKGWDPADRKLLIVASVNWICQILVPSEKVRQIKCTARSLRRHGAHEIVKTHARKVKILDLYEI